MLTLQTAVLTGELEWEDWGLIPGAQLPTKESVEKRLPGYYDMYNPESVKNRNEYLDTIKDRFKQRIGFLNGTDVAEKKELWASLANALRINV